MKHNLLLLFAMLGLPCTFHASELNTSAGSFLAEEPTEVKPTHFILNLKDGGSAAFLLAHTPMVTNGNGFITVTDEDIIIDYPLSNVYSYMMGVDESTTGIGNQESADKGTFEKRCGVMMLSGFKPGSKVIVTSINGSCVQSDIIGNDGCTEINISAYAPGIYLFKINNQTFKITKR